MKQSNLRNTIFGILAALVAMVGIGCGPADDSLPTQPPQEPNPQQPVDPAL